MNNPIDKKTKRKRIIIIVVFVLLVGLDLFYTKYITEQVEKMRQEAENQKSDELMDTTTEAENEGIKAEPTYPSSTIKRVSVHDPSIVKDEKSGKLYIYGSHLAVAETEDLINWTSLNSGYQNAGNNPVFGNVYENFADSFKWAGFDDGDCSNKGLAVWAPDVSYDPFYEWADGTKGAYLMYYSASSTWRRSCIGLAVSKEVNGPFIGIDTVVYSGMTKSGNTDGKSTRNTAFDNDYLNFSELIALGAENGGIDSANSKWFKDAGQTYNTNYAPNCIDPCVIDGKDGKMYLVYGSWSGGLFILEIDEKTGLLKYPGVDGTDEESGNFIDRYYGVHIAGGYHQSGEGPFILYDEETDYYYLYETYDGLAKDGGYNMRLFRSKNIYGPYLDAAGQNSNQSGSTNYKYGIKLIGNYAFKNQTGYKSAGHNSAYIDKDGRHFIIYHQRFDIDSEYFEVRVHEQFMNEDLWPVTAVYENRNTPIGNYDYKDVYGDYEIFDFGIGKVTKMQQSETVSLKDDGKLYKGEEAIGTWEKKDSLKGYDYVTMVIGTVTYKGVFYFQADDTGKFVMTFSLIGDNNEVLWGSKL